MRQPACADSKAAAPSQEVLSPVLSSECQLNGCCVLSLLWSSAEHRAVLPQCAGVALLSDRQPEQDRLTPRLAAHRTVKPPHAWGQHNLHSTGGVLQR